METFDVIRPLSRRSEDSGLAMSIGSSRGSSPIDLKLGLSPMSCSTISLNSSTAGGGSNLGSPTSESNPTSSLKNNNVNKNNGQNSIPHFQRSRSLYNPGGLKKKPLSHLKKSRTLSTDETNNSTADSTDVLLPRYKQMKCITMEVKRSSFGRKGWIAKPVDESLDLKQLQLNGALEKLINDLRVMELSGKDIPKLITIRLD